MRRARLTAALTLVGVCRRARPRATCSRCGRAVPINPDGVEVPRDYTVEFTEIERAFFLDAGHRPGPSFVKWEGSVTPTPQNPEAVVWGAG